jgi:ferrochelatase
MKKSLSPSQPSHKGVLLLNLGTPDEPSPSAVRKYLKQFLMDPYVIDIPLPLRWLLVHGAILPKRPVLAAAAYQKVWTERGSPLLFHLLDLTEKVQIQLGNSWKVQPAMRYGEPSLRQALNQLQKLNISELVVLPLYPQYSLAATESSIQECLKELKYLKWDVPVRFVKHFFESESFIKAFAAVARESLGGYSYDHLLFSFHGLPERQIRRTDSSGIYCLSSELCCDQMNEANQNCYKAQCYRSARLIAQELNLDSDRYTICFQSRLGRTPWIKPYTDDFYRELPKKGVRRLAVMCPAFVADCLETLEEVQIRGKEEFIRNGGEDLKLISSLNSSDAWANTVSQLVTLC